MVYGPLSLQGEYIASVVDTVGLDPATPFPFTGSGKALFQGYYAYASFFLTGEHRPYKTSKGVFDRVKPNNPFSLKNGGWGAWEAAFRFSRLDLSDGALNSSIGAGSPNVASFGTINNYTMALNWYLNPNFRVLVNYIISDPDPNGLAHLVNTRLSLNF